MGTNYYVQGKPCECCGQATGEKKHIGKSSGGWCFSLHVIPEDGLNDLPAWVTYWQDKQIVNEYGNVIPPDEMYATITERSNHSTWVGKPPFGYPSWETFHISNHSEQGEKGLLRHKIDGRHCVGHGAGTWDLVTGEFS